MSMDRQSGDALDGNAAGGRLRELFALDVTAAEIICDGCGAITEVGAVRSYGGAMGAVLRCAHCDTVVLRLTIRRPAYGSICAARAVFSSARRRRKVALPERSQTRGRMP